ncbi:MAG: Uma2 family endonuclease [Chloroflexi bacterium]|nr:Uma2 family endonuclease [Chloroflexota bacterium]
MNLQTITIPRSLPSGEIVAVDIDEDTYMTQYAENHHEWIKGVVVRMAPVSLVHDAIVNYLRDLLRAFLSQTNGCRVLSDPFVMRLSEIESNRQPDLQVICGDNLANLKETFMDGPANICIEVISPGSVAIDYGEKLQEYEQGKVFEYWIIDPMRRTCTFYRLNEEGYYQPRSLNTQQEHETSVLPGFRLHVPTLWTEPLPDYGQVWAMIQDML